MPSGAWDTVTTGAGIFQGAKDAIFGQGKYGRSKYGRGGIMMETCFQLDPGIKCLYNASTIQKIKLWQILVANQVHF